MVAQQVVLFLTPAENIVAEGNWNLPNHQATALRGRNWRNSSSGVFTADRREKRSLTLRRIVTTLLLSSCVANSVAHQ
ncbi:hypothetical protein KCP78_14050 [Salmonella enterica subsp. enterica]|nr:hypothetical protein KCP78_14050 [Salmonella enterica subsp. enterica]